MQYAARIKQHPLSMVCVGEVGILQPVAAQIKLCVQKGTGQLRTNQPLLCTLHAILLIPKGMAGHDGGA